MISPGCRFGVHLFVVTVNGFTIVNFTPNVHTRLILAILGFSGTCVIKSVPILPWFHNWGNRPCPQTKTNHRKASSIIPLKQTKGFNPNYRFKEPRNYSNLNLAVSETPSNHNQPPTNSPPGRALMGLPQRWIRNIRTHRICGAGIFTFKMG